MFRGGGGVEREARGREGGRGEAVKEAVIL